MYHERQQLQRCLLHALNNLLQQQAWSVASLNQLCDDIHATRTRWMGNYDANVLAAALDRHGLEVQWHDARDTKLASLDLNPHPCRGSSSSSSTQPQQAAHTQQLQQQQQQGQPADEDRQQQQQSQQPQRQQQNQQQDNPLDEGQQQQQQQDQHEQQQQQQWELVGLVLNVAGRGLLSHLMGGRHWLVIRWLEGAWWNLDSQLPHPVSFAAAAGSGCSEQPADVGHTELQADADAAAAAGAAGAAAEDGGAAALRVYLQQQLAAGGLLLIVRRQAHSTAGGGVGGGAGGAGGGGGDGAAAGCTDG